MCKAITMQLLRVVGIQIIFFVLFILKPFLTTKSVENLVPFYTFFANIRNFQQQQELKRLKQYKWYRDFSSFFILFSETSGKIEKKRKY